MKTFFEFISIFYPLIIAAAFTYILFFRSKFEGIFIVRIKYIGVEMETPFQRQTIYRTLFVLIILQSIIFFALRDYSSFMPKLLKYNVYYDVEGIRQNLSTIENRTSKFKIKKDWEAERLNVYKRLDKILNKNTDYKGKFFTSEKIEKYLTSQGRADHSMVYLKFWQNYKVTQVSGDVDYVLHTPNSKSVDLKTSYYLLDTPDNLISLSFKDFLKASIVTKSTMGHSLNKVHERGIIKGVYDEEIIGLTYVSFFPTFSLKFTVFCSSDHKGELIPYAYTVYEHEVL